MAKKTPATRAKQPARTSAARNRAVARAAKPAARAAAAGPDVRKVSHPAQVASIERYQLDDGPGRGVRALCVNTGGGLRYRVLVDRGLDIDQAFFNQHSLTSLGFQGVTRPTRALDRGLDWIKGFPVGLLTSCGPFNVGAPAVDQGEELGLHSVHSNTAASLEMVVSPDLREPDHDELEIHGTVRYGQLYGPQVVLKRSITSRVGGNEIEVFDQLTNYGNTTIPHAWLLHVNLGYPLCDEGAEFSWDAKKVEPRDDPQSKAFFARPEKAYKTIPAPLPDHAGTGAAVCYVQPRAGEDGRTTCGVINRRLGLKFSLSYYTKEFPRLGCWQHWGEGDYVCALEPMNGTVDGRDQDRARGLMDQLKPGESRQYVYTLAVEPV
jgi:hypothetical protein